MKNAKEPRDEERCGVEQHNSEERQCEPLSLIWGWKAGAAGGVRTETTSPSVISPQLLAVLWRAEKPSRRTLQGEAVKASWAKEMTGGHVRDGHGYMCRTLVASDRGRARLHTIHIIALALQLQRFQLAVMTSISDFTSLLSLNQTFIRCRDFTFPSRMRFTWNVLSHTLLIQDKMNG